MKKFIFTLQRLLGFKQTMYDRENNILAQLRAERVAVETRRDNLIRQDAEMDAEYRHKAATTGVSAEELRQVSFQRDSSARLIEDLEKEMNRLDAAIEKQLQVVIELDKEVQSLEKLRERQWEDYQAEAAREEQERILELVSRTFVDSQAEAAEEEARALQKQQQALRPAGQPG